MIHGWNFQTDPIIIIKLKISSSNINIWILSTLSRFQLSLISQTFSITSCTSSGPMKTTSPISNEPIGYVHLLPYRETYQHLNDNYYYMQIQSKANDHPNYPWSQVDKISYISQNLNSTLHLLIILIMNGCTKINTSITPFLIDNPIRPFIYNFYFPEWRAPEVK